MNYSHMDIETCPCKGCLAPKRHCGCHSNCEEYLNWKGIYDKEKARLDHEKWMKQIGLKSKF